MFSVKLFPVKLSLRWLMKKLTQSMSYSKNNHYNKEVVVDGANKIIKYSMTKKHNKARKGFVAMYVIGNKDDQHKIFRYHVPIKYLSVPTFQELIVKSLPSDLDHQLEAKIEGPLMLSCTSQFFDHSLKIIAKECS